MSAAKRLVEAHRTYWKAQGYSDIPPDRVHDVLENVRNGLYGIDLNPFACSLAETNLLIQVIDLIAIAMKADEPTGIHQLSGLAEGTTIESVEKNGLLIADTQSSRIRVAIGAALSANFQLAC